MPLWGAKLCCAWLQPVCWNTYPAPCCSYFPRTGWHPLGDRSVALASLASAILLHSYAGALVFQSWDQVAKLPLEYSIGREIGLEVAHEGQDSRARLIAWNRGLEWSLLTWERRLVKSFSWLLPKAMANTKWCANMSLQLIPGKSPRNSVAGPVMSPVSPWYLSSATVDWFCTGDSGGPGKAKYKMPEGERGKERKREGEGKNMQQTQNKPPVPDKSTFQILKHLERKL